MKKKHIQIQPELLNFISILCSIFLPSTGDPQHNPAHQILRRQRVEIPKSGRCPTTLPIGRFIRCSIVIGRPLYRARLQLQLHGHHHQHQLRWRPGRYSSNRKWKCRPVWELFSVWNSKPGRSPQKPVQNEELPQTLQGCPDWAKSANGGHVSNHTSRSDRPASTAGPTTGPASSGGSNSDRQLVSGRSAVRDTAGR